MTIYVINILCYIILLYYSRLVSYFFWDNNYFNNNTFRRKNILILYYTIVQLYKKNLKVFEIFHEIKIVHCNYNFEQWTSEHLSRIKVKYPWNPVSLSCHRQIDYIQLCQPRDHKNNRNLSKQYKWKAFEIKWN